MEMSISGHGKLVSIIMAAYNAEKTIRQAIESVLEQTYINFELVVVNDCSNDETVSIVQEYIEKDPRIRLIHNEKNMGVSHTRLHGLDVVTGDWIAILDSDDMWRPDKLEKQMELQFKTEASLLYTGSAFMDHAGKHLEWTMHVPEQVSFRELLKQNILSNSSALCRTELYKTHYMIGDHMHEDFAIWLKILKTGVIAYGVDEPLLVYRLSQHSKSSNKVKAARMNWNTYRAVGLNSIDAFYNMVFYTIKSIAKYSHLK